MLGGIQEEASAMLQEASTMLLSFTDKEERVTKPVSNQVIPANSKLEATQCSSVKVHAFESKTFPVATYIKQPDGSLWMANPARSEDAHASRPSSPKPRQNYPEILCVFMKALGRRELIRKLLNIGLVINFLLGALGLAVLLADPDMPSSVSSRFFWIPVVWLGYAAVQFLLGLVVISNARHELYGMLVSTSTTAVMMHFAIALMVSKSGIPAGVASKSLAAVLIPITVITDLPMRLAVGFQATLLQKEMRYLRQLPLGVLQELS